MGLSTAVGSFLWATSDSVSTTFDISTSFPVKAAILVATSRDSATDAVGAPAANDADEMAVAVGFCAGPTQRWGVGAYAEEAAGTTDAHRHSSATAVLPLVDDVETSNGLLDIASLDDGAGGDGISFIVDEVCGTNMRVHYLLIGGSTVSAHVGNGTSPTSATTKAFTGVGFTPELLVTLTAFGGIGLGRGARVSVGAADGTSQGAISSDMPDDVATPAAGAYSRTGECLTVMNNATSVLERAAWDSFDADGFTLNWVEAHGTAWPFGHLCLAGESFHVGTVASSTSTGAIAETGVGFLPSGLFVFSHCRAESASDTPDADQIVSLGMTDGTNDRAAGWRLADADDPTNIAEAIEYDAVYARVDESADTLDGAISLTSFDADGFTLNQDVADDTAALIHYIAFGPPAPVREQEGYRWRADDGSESAASWLAAQDTDISRDVDTVTRLRLLTDVVNDAPSEAVTLQYRRVGTPAWLDVPVAEF